MNIVRIRDIGPAGHFRIESAKKNPKGISEEQLDVLCEELATEQAEMAELTSFLRERYFEEASS